MESKLASESQKKSRFESIISMDLHKKQKKTIWEKLYSLPEPNNEGLAKIKKEPRKFLEPVLDLLFGEPKETCVYCKSLNSIYYTVCKVCAMPIDGGDLDKITFSKNFWDYLDDLKYMPSLDDRKRVADSPSDEDYGNRVKIWDYFFRIRPDDLGQPQKYCIELLKDYTATLSAISEEIKKESGEVKRSYIRQREENISKLKNLLYRLQPNVQHLDSIDLNKNNFNEIRQQVEEVIQMLEEMIVHLQNEARNVKPPEYSEIRKWLKKDLKREQQAALDRMGIANLLATRHIEIEDELGKRIRQSNPLIFISPGQLQDLEKIPKQYQPYPSRSTDEYISLLDVIPIPDKAKHLLARRLANEQATEQNNVENSLLFQNLTEQNDAQGTDDILFAVHYIEHICIGKYLLVQNSFFYDFVSGQVVGESVTEHYYQDIVSIQRNHEFRRMPIDYSESIYLEIENVPVFRMRLASGHSHSVTFLSEELKLELYKLLLEERNQSKHGANNSRIILRLDNVQSNEEGRSMAAAAVLRQQLRLHKALIKNVELTK